jgi:hypothetical protein
MKVLWSALPAALLLVSASAFAVQQRRRNVWGNIASVRLAAVSKKSDHEYDRFDSAVARFFGIVTAASILSFNAVDADASANIYAYDSQTCKFDNEVSMKRREQT